MTILHEHDVDGLRELLVGQRVIKVGADSLQLENGTMLQLEGYGDCCAGYELTVLNDCPNIITNVMLNADLQGDDYPGEGRGVYELFVLADNQRINLATFSGTESNGYYSAGFRVKVIPAAI